MEGFVPPTLGAFLGGILTDLFIRKWFEAQDKERLLKNLSGDLKYNLAVNQEVKRVFKENIINVAHYVYATDGIRDFVYKKAFKKRGDFYNKLLKLLVLLESSNKLLQAALFRVDSGQHVIVENSIRSNTVDIEEILKRVIKEIDSWKNWNYNFWRWIKVT